MKTWAVLIFVVCVAIAIFGLHYAEKQEGYEQGRASIIDSLDLTPIPKTEVKLTAYSPDSRSCGKWADGKTATMGDASKPGAAVDPSVIPYGSIIILSDGSFYRVDDTGGAMRKATKQGTIHIDIRMPTHEQAMQFGVKTDSIVILMR